MARARLCARNSRLLDDALVVHCELTLGGPLTKSTDENRDIASTENLVHADLLKHEAVRTQPACWDQRFGFGCEPRFSRDMPQFGKICSMEYATKAGLCRRLSRRVNMIASKNPVKAPRNASVIERLLKVRPWPVRRNPVYAIATVQRIMRTGCMG